MVATVTTKLYWSTGPTESDLTGGNIRFCTADLENPGNTYPIPIPGASYNYSYTKTIAFYVSVAPDTSITGIYLYTDGSLGWGTDAAVYIGNQQVNAYVQATGTPGTTGAEATTFYTGVTSVSSFFGYTSGAPYGPITQAATSSTGRYSYYVILQARIGTGASSGAKTPEIGTWRYNEV
jgi:hypothetical protein